MNSEKGLFIDYLLMELDEIGEEIEKRETNYFSLGQIDMLSKVQNMLMRIRLDDLKNE